MLATIASRFIQLDKIAVLTDLGPDAERTLHYAARLGRWYGSKLVVAHALPQGNRVSSEAQQSPISRANPELHANDKLTSMVEKIGLQDLSPKLMVHEGGITELLNELADYHPSLVLLATHGREGVEKWLRGSVAEEVFRGVPWPVMVLGPRTEINPSERQFQLHCVLYATDLSGTSFSAMQYAAGIAHDHEAQLIALHVEPDAHDDFTFDRMMRLQKLQDWLKDHIDGLADALESVQCEVMFGDPQKTILQAAAEHRADLLVMGARGLGSLAASGSHFLGGTAYEVVCNSRCPVLIVPQP